MDLLNKHKVSKGAMDGSVGVRMRYYSARVFFEGAEVQAYRTLDEVVALVEEVLTREQGTMISVGSYVVSPEEYEKVFFDGPTD
jgi:hypothetical protein